ncbi:MAG: helix-turn-helix transcriptional regulator [Rhodospirillaceae bacterium]|jgi:DNA-binding CsgD family transcriptional regulator|nr:helix-turn-helix transcriptional regulator [Rhodospirillaceae bacterium]MBT5895772.1 helix-turn-helix transcriptional regulator [Rhodospirillaceae bacterium]
MGKKSSGAEPARNGRISASFVQTSQTPLNSSEAQLATVIATSQDIGTCANQMGITAETARGYLKRIFSKTDTSRQAELVHLLLNLPRLARHK